MFLSIPTLYSGEKVLWLANWGDGLRDEVYTADLRDHRGQHPLDGHQSSSVAGLAGQTWPQTCAWGFVAPGEPKQAGLDNSFAESRNYYCMGTRHICWRQMSQMWWVYKEDKTQPCYSSMILTPVVYDSQNNGKIKHNKQKCPDPLMSVNITNNYPKLDRSDLCIMTCAYVP